MRALLLNATNVNAVHISVACLAAACAPTDPTGPFTGQVIWHVAGTGWVVTPSFDSTTVYFGGRWHEVVAVSRSTGQELWRATTGRSGSYTDGRNTVVSGNSVAVGDVDVHVYDRSNGSLRYIYSPSAFDNTGRDFLAADDSIIYTPSFLGRVYAFYSATGAGRWVAVIGDSSTVTFHPVLDDSLVVVGTKRFGNPALGSLVVLRRSNGDTVWTRPFLPEVQGQYSGCLGGAAVTSDRIFVTAEDGRVYAFEKSTGDTVWIAPRVHSLPPEGGWNDNRALTTNGSVVVVGSNTGVVVGLSAATGAELWRSASSSRGSVDRGMVNDGFLAFVNHGSNLVAYEMATGRIVWQSGSPYYGQGTQYWPGPAIDGDRMYVSGAEGFFALRMR